MPRSWSPLLGLALSLLLLVPGGQALAGAGNLALLAPLGVVGSLVVARQEQDGPIAAEVDEDAEQDRLRWADGVRSSVCVRATRAYR